MDLRALTAAAVRFFALYTLLSCVDTLAEIAEALALPKELSSGTLPYFLATQLVVLLLASWFLLTRTQLVTGWCSTARRPATSRSPSRAATSRSPPSRWRA
jgi:hypothetical protein